MKKLVVIVGFFLLFSINAWAQNVYHVNKNHPNAQDSNPGTEDFPWLTIQHAADAIKAGELCLVHEGVYDEYVQTNNDGMEWAPIKFKVIAGDEAIVRGFSINNDYILIEGFEITGPCPDLAYIYFKDNSSHCSVVDTTVHDGEFQKYSVYLSNGSRYCMVQNSTFDNNNYIFMALKGTCHLVENNTFTNCPGWDAIHFFGQGHCIRGNYFEEINKTGRFQGDIYQTFGTNNDYCYDILIENNFHINCNTKIGNFESNGRDIRRITFINNVFINVAAAANVWVRDVAWYNNIFYNCSKRNDGDVITFYNDDLKGSADNGVVRNNIFVGCGGINDATSGWYSVDAILLPSFDADYNYVAQRKENEWKSKNGFFELNGINGGDPYFADIGSDDYHLLEGSPAIDSACDLSYAGFSCDKDGVSRLYKGAWDRGAYEYIPN